MKPIERVELIIKQEGLPVSVFEKKIGMSNNSIQMAIKRKAKLKDETLNSILKSFPRINPEWLLTGDGPMFRAEKNPPDGTLDPEKKMAPNLAPNSEKKDKKGTSGDSSGLEERIRLLEKLLEEKERLLGEKDGLIALLRDTISMQKEAKNETIEAQNKTIGALHALVMDYEDQLEKRRGGISNSGVA